MTERTDRCECRLPGGLRTGCTLAIGLLQQELTEIIALPGGGVSSIDLPPAVHEALGLPGSFALDEDE